MKDAIHMPQKNKQSRTQEKMCIIAGRTRAGIRGFTRLPCETWEHIERTGYWDY